MPSYNTFRYLERFVLSLVSATTDNSVTLRGETVMMEKTVSRDRINLVNIITGIFNNNTEISWVITRQILEQKRCFQLGHYNESLVNLQTVRKQINWNYLKALMKKKWVSMPESNKWTVMIGVKLVNKSFNNLWNTYDETNIRQ